MNLGGMDIFDSPLPGEDHARVKEAVPAGDSPQGNARCARLMCREAARNAVCEHRLWTFCIPGMFFAEPPAKPRSTQVFKTRGHGRRSLHPPEQWGHPHLTAQEAELLGLSHLPAPAHTSTCPHSPTPAHTHTCPHLHLPTLTHTCPHPLTPTHPHTWLITANFSLTVTSLQRPPF